MREYSARGFGGAVRVVYLVVLERDLCRMPYQAEWL